MTRCVRLLVAIGLLLGGCAAPLAVERLDAEAAYRRLNRTALADGRLGEATLTALRRRGLPENLGARPDATIAALHAAVVGDPAAWPELFALAEASYARARRTGAPGDHLAAAVYAYAFLFPGEGSPDRPDPFDPRFRQASDLYNLSLAAAMTPVAGGPAVFRPGRHAVPFGAVDVAVDEDSLGSGGRALTSFQPTATLAVAGLRNRYRTPGLGAAVAAGVAAPPSPAASAVQVAPRLRVPGTALLEIPQPRRQLAAGGPVRGTLAVHTVFGPGAVRIDGRRVPLEFDHTAARAYSLVESRAWADEYRGFLAGDLFGGLPDARLVALEPHRPGRMPVVLVHGTASSPFRWADMVNDLGEDPRVRDHYEFWFFSYATGNPIPYSALLLRDALRAAVRQLGGEASDPALGRIVLVGHSQGGLLARMATVDAGPRLWDAVSRRPLEALRLDADARELIRRSVFVEPVPQVGRVVFVATPHRGSYLTEFSAARLVGRLVTLPAAVARAGSEALAGNADALAFDPARWRPGSLYGMTPGNPFFEALARLPTAPGVRAHSIVPALGDGPLAGRSDGVVRYASAHLDGVESELVVRSGHSVQANPSAIEEVRRILLLHLAEAGPRLPSATASASAAQTP